MSSRTLSKKAGYSSPFRIGSAFVLLTRKWCDSVFAPLLACGGGGGGDEGAGETGNDPTRAAS